MEKEARHQKNRRGQLSTLAKGLSVLELFASTGTELGISEVSRHLSLPKSTVHRIVSTLTAHGYLRQDEPTGSYRLGLKCWEIGCTAVAQLNLVDVARPHLHRLAERSGENVRLTTLEDGEIVYIYAVDGSQVLRPFSRVGQRGPAHGTGTGLVLLAHQPAEVIARLARQGLAPLADGRVMTAEELKRELEKVRESGVAVVRGGWHADVASVAAPIRNHTGNVVAAAGVGGAVTRFTDEAVARFSKMVLASMAAISEELGYRA